MAPRWQPVAVLAALAAPPVALAVLVWPTQPAGVAAGAGDDIEATVPVGGSAAGTVSGTFSADYEVVGDGSGTVVVSVAGDGGFDATLTLVDPDDGEQLDFNDDADGLDPRLLVDLDDGESVIAEVRSLGGQPGSFTISVTTEDGSDPVPTTGPPPPRAGPVTTIVAG